MKKKVLLFILSTLLSQAGIYAQSIYAEVGFNTLGKVDYTNLDHIDFKSERSLIPQKSIEVGLKHQVSQTFVISMGLSSNAYNFTNNLYVSIDSTTSDHVHVKSLFELGYLGGNLGVDIALVEKDQWSLFTCGKLSGNLLDRGVRTDDPSILPNPNTNLMLDENFEKLWFNIQFGFRLSYKVSSSMALYTRYNFNQSLTTIKNDQESYDFNSHAFSVGLTFNIREHGEDKERLLENHQLTNHLETKSMIDQTDLDLTLRSADKLHVEDSALLKIYFPPNSTDFYENHTIALKEMAELLLKDRLIRYHITGYYDGPSKKNECIVSLHSVFDFLIERGVLREQLIVGYKQEQSQGTPKNIWSRRVELIKENNK
jgi:hypothetical protein